MIYTFMYIYLMKSIGEDVKYKIGFTKSDPNKRLKQLRTGNGDDIVLIDFFESKYATKIEKSLHFKYKEDRLNGEWFYLNNNIESDFKEICLKEHQLFDILYTSNTYLKIQNSIN